MYYYIGVIINVLLYWRYINIILAVYQKTSMLNINF